MTTTNGLASQTPLKEPKLYDVLQTFKQSLLLNLHCVKIGQIEKFYASTFSADISILLQRTMTNGSTSSYPKLLNCPVLTLQGGGASIQFPIKSGDQCLVLFSDRNINNWYQEGSAQPPADGRLHDISDAIAIVGLNYSQSNAIPDIDSSEARFILSDGTTKVGLESGKITVANASGTLLSGMSDLLTALQNLCTALGSLTITDPQGGTGTISPASAAAVVAVSVSLTSVSSELTALLY